MKATDQVAHYMTPCPLTVGPATTILEAVKKMHDNDIRHLPVVGGSKVIGILSDREIKRYAEFMDTDRVLAVDVMVQEPYHVDKTKKMSEVLTVMAKNKFGSVVVTGSGGRVVGIFTTTDALQYLAQAIR